MSEALCLLLGLLVGGGVVWRWNRSVLSLLTAAQSRYDEQVKQQRQRLDDELSVLNRRLAEMQQDAGAVWKQLKELDERIEAAQQSDMASIKRMMTEVASSGGLGSRRAQEHPPIGAGL